MRAVSKSILPILLLAALSACGDDPGAVMAGNASNYTGPHGIGILVDNPNESRNVDDWPTCSDGAQHPDCRDAPLGY